MPEPENTQQFNQDALRGMISDAVRATVGNMAAEARARSEQERQAAIEAQNRHKQNQALMESPVTQTVLGDPGVQKVIGDVAFTAENAMDHTRFYMSNPEALAREAEIERIALNGRLNRQSAYTYMLGQDAMRTQQANRLARGEMGVGQGGLGRPDPNASHPSTSITPFTTVEHNRKALEGVSF